MTNLLIGCDPEVFVFDTKAGKYVTGHGLIPGTKDKPFKVDGGAVQVDGMALEFNIDPASSSEEFVGNIEKVLKALKGMLPPHLELAAKPTVEFGKAYLSTMPEEAVELGCEPDYNAYTGKENPRPNAASTFRTSAGHIHIGWTEGMDPKDPDHFEACCMFAKFLDYHLGATAALWDEDDKRRQLYGDRGAFRPKPYGMEYRSPSSAWLMDKRIWAVIPKLVNKAWEAAMETGGEVSGSMDRISQKTFQGSKQHLRDLNAAFETTAGFSLIKEEEKAGAKVDFSKDWPFTIEPDSMSQILVKDFDAVKESFAKSHVKWVSGEEIMEYKPTHAKQILLGGCYLIDVDDYPFELEEVVFYDLLKQAKKSVKIQGAPADPFAEERKYFIKL